MSKRTRKKADFVFVDPPYRFVLVPVFARATGYTPKAIYRKIERGDWVEGQEFRRAPDGHIVIDNLAVQQWIG